MFFLFTKMHGIGNCYIYINLFEEQLEESLYPALATQVSNISTGIGADGMILIDSSNVASVKMRIFNSDGSEGKNCGNGLRCVAKYVYEKKIVTETTFKIETMSGVVEATVEVNDEVVTNVTVNMGTPRLQRSQIPMIGNNSQVIMEEIEFAGQTLQMTAVSMGNPHAIFYVPNIEDAPVTTLGPMIETDSRFPDRVNVEFVEVVNERELHFRVWERGSGVTKACGTGACAAVVASVLNGKTNRNEETVVHLEGGDLFVTWTDQGNVLMKGSAEIICTGVYYY